MIFKLKEVAKERALTLTDIAKKLGIHRANMSAIASGSRGTSLKMLKKIVNILDMGLDELVNPEECRPVFKNRKAEAALDNMEKINYDGLDKTWVNKVMLAQNAHYHNVRKNLP
jgi:transcriptional regulator with XRE-family HTH domain